MEQVHMIGIDLAKQSFQLHGARGWIDRVSEKARQDEDARLFGVKASLSGGDGGVRECALLGSSDQQTRP